MKLNDKIIAKLGTQELFSSDLFYSLLEISELEERKRLEGLAKIRAKELKCSKEFCEILKMYNQAQTQLTQHLKNEQAESDGEPVLEYDDNGKLASSIDNFLQIIKSDDYFSGLKFNELTYSPEIEIDGKTRRWTDADDAEARRYIEKEYHIHNVQKSDDAFRIVFEQNKYHPVRQLVESFEWDGEERISGFLHKWTKCEDTPYTREVSRLIFAGGIHRLYNPGCKFDEMPVLIGTKQGEGKSTLVRWIALKDDFFAEVNEFDGQRGIESLEGAWICEVSELLAMTKAREQEAVKSYLTRLNDRYRMPFDKRVTDHPRQCVFIGTTNKEQFLTDKTGNRRFFPIKVRQEGHELFQHKEEIQTDIRQCWAEAKCKYDAGKIAPYADHDLIQVIRQMQEDAVEDDYRVGMIADYLSSCAEVCVLELWQQALKMGDFSKPAKKDSNEIGLIMQNFEDWDKQPKVKRFKDFGVQRWWKKKKNFEDLPFEL